MLGVCGGNHHRFGVSMRLKVLTVSPRNLSTMIEWKTFTWALPIMDLLVSMEIFGESAHTPLTSHCPARHNTLTIGLNVY